MTALQTDIGGVTGAKRQSWNDANPRALLEKLFGEDPRATEQDLASRFLEEITKGVGFSGRAGARNRQVIETIVIDYWLHNNYRSLVGPSPAVKQQRRNAAAVETQQLAGRIAQNIQGRVQIILLDMLLPSGKSLRNSTREELLDLGGWTTKVAERLQPDQTVGEAGLSEATLRELYG